MDYYEDSPMSEQTLKRHKWRYNGFEYHNDLGYPCLYRVLKDGKELGVIQYYGGRKLVSMERR